MTIWVGRLPQGTSKEDLRKLFAGYPSLSVTNVIDRSDARGPNCFAFLEGDAATEARAIREMNGRLYQNSRIRVSEGTQKPTGPARPGTGVAHRPASPSSPGAKSAPYTFTERPTNPSPMPAAGPHAMLREGAYDIAFDIEWKTLTPVAANPCTIGGPTQAPGNTPGEYEGYANRWLMVDGRLALSPFTVKSAIANAFAAVAGGCYRVIENKVAADQGVGEGYPFGGEWKRYRVSMNSSKPGLLKKLDLETGDVEIEPVTEYYYDEQNLPFPAPPRHAEFVSTFRHPMKRNGQPDRNKRIINADAIRPAAPGCPRQQGEVLVRYDGPYHFGMNLTLGPGQFGKSHWHRFYEPSGRTLQGRVDPKNFGSASEQGSVVYMGRFKKLEQTAPDPRQGLEGGNWHQDLVRLRRDDWVYYEAFQAEGERHVTSIGLNFQYKTLFRHRDAVSPTQRACGSGEELCPRCALFGFTGKIPTEGKGDAVGLRGRFKAATLTCTTTAREAESPAVWKVPSTKDGGVRLIDTPARVWADDTGREVARQFLLPLQGPPKPNKRDVRNGYFDENTGRIRGAKRYLHGGVGYDPGKAGQGPARSFPKLIQDEDCHPALAEDARYRHELRRWAQVCREGLVFQGTVGAECCSADEVAALLMVLDSRLGGHGFKIGLGKASGLGSVEPRVKRVWIRGNKEYAESRWEALDLSNLKDQAAILAALGQAFEQVKKALPAIIPGTKRLNALQGRETRVLEYPPPKDYWRNFQPQE